MSDSTHIPPVGTHCPLATFAAMRAKSSGWPSSIHAYCCACEQTNRYSGCSSISRTAEANVRSHLRRVSRIGHSQAVSMCACPVATIRWALDRAGVANAAPTAWRAAATSGTRSRARAMSRNNRRRRGSSSWSVRIKPSRTPRSCMSASASESTTTRSARLNRYSGSSPAVAGDPRGDGRNCGNDGFEAASTVSTSRPGSGSTATLVRCGWIPWTGCPASSRTRPSHWNPAASRWKPRSITASTRRPAQSCGISPVRRNHVVPHGAPHLEPTAKSVSRSSVGPASTPSGIRSASTSGTTRSHHSRAMRRSTSARSSCTPARYPTPGNDPSELSASDCRMRHLKQTERGFRRGFRRG